MALGNNNNKKTIFIGNATAEPKHAELKMKPGIPVIHLASHPRGQKGSGQRYTLLFFLFISFISILFYFYFLFCYFLFILHDGSCKYNITMDLQHSNMCTSVAEWFLHKTAGGKFSFPKFTLGNQTSNLMKCGINFVQLFFCCNGWWIDNGV